MNLRTLLVAAAFACPPLVAQSLPAVLMTDPGQDKANPAALQSFQLPSHGEKLNALVYVAAGAGPHGVVVLLHGFPGNEKNLDIAQAIRRAGWDVLFFNYRGSWGSPGDFSFTHAIEDAETAVAYLRDPANAARLRSDPKNIVVVGHSMGGMITSIVGSQDPGIRAVGLISAADIAGRALPAIKAGHGDAVIAPMAKGLAGEGMAPLAGCTPESLAKDAVAHAEAWWVPGQATGLGRRPVLIVTSDDGLAPSSDALATELGEGKNTHITTLHLATDHSYSDKRITLTAVVLDWLAKLPPQ